MQDVITKWADELTVGAAVELCECGHGPRRVWTTGTVVKLTKTQIHVETTSNYGAKLHKFRRTGRLQLVKLGQRPRFGFGHTEVQPCGGFVQVDPAQPARMEQWQAEAKAQEEAQALRVLSHACGVMATVLYDHTDAARSERNRCNLTVLAVALEAALRIVKPSELEREWARDLKVLLTKREEAEAAQ